jgi:UDP-glucose 4-epimerase
MIPKNIVVTGGVGFIGQILVNRFQTLGHKVLVLDKQFPQNGNGYGEPILNQNVRFEYADITKPDELNRVLSKDVDVVCHLAGLVADDANANPYHAVYINELGTANILEACRIHKIPKVLFASTFLIYENCGRDLVDETTAIDITNLSPFSRSKLFSEQLIKDYQKKHGIRYIIMRFGSVYGRGYGSNVIRTFIEQALKGETISVWGEGKRTRQFIYLEDLADAVVVALDQENELFNICGKAQTSTRSILESLQELMPDMKVFFDPTKKEKVESYYISIKKASDKFGWTPKTSIDEGLKRTTEWFKGQLKIF